MPSEDEKPRSEREQTDESLRAERDKADQAIGEKLAAIEETADAVIDRARERADRVLAAARAKLDQQAASLAHGGPTPGTLARERVLEDTVVREERADADEALRAERAEHVALLSSERAETDKDLSSERILADVALATRDDFLAIVSHDLRSMLNTMTGSASLIARDITREDPPASILGHAERIQRAGTRMNRLIGDLVDVASIQAGVLAVTREVGDATQVVTEATESFQALASARGISLEATVAPLPLASFDPARILQVLTNLVSNAIKFTPAGGKVDVCVERAAEEILFVVSDTGLGIPIDKLEAIFERYLQIIPGDRRGVGLGLYISKCIVQGHGGRIWAERRRGGGTSLSFTLPIHRER